MSQDISLIARCKYIAELLKNSRTRNAAGTGWENSVFLRSKEYLEELLTPQEQNLLSTLDSEPAYFHFFDPDLRKLFEQLTRNDEAGEHKEADFSAILQLGMFRDGFLASLASYTDHEFKVLKEQLAQPESLRKALDTINMSDDDSPVCLNIPLPTRLMGYTRALYQTRYFDVDKPAMLVEMQWDMVRMASQNEVRALLNAAKGNPFPPEPEDGTGFAPEGKFVRRTGKPQLEILDSPSPNAAVMLPGIDAISNRSYSGALKALVALVEDRPEISAESYVFSTPEDQRWYHDRALLASGPGDNYACPEAREYVRKFILPEILENEALSAEKLAGFHRQFFGNSFGARFLIRIENALREALDERGISTEQQRLVFDRITAVTVSSPDLMYQRTPGTAGFRTLHIFSADDSGTALPSPFLEVTHLEDAANRQQPTLYHLPDTPLPGVAPEEGQNTHRNSLLFIPHGQVLPTLEKNGEKITNRQHNPGNYSAWTKENPPVMALVQEMLKGPGNGEAIAAFHQRLDGMLEGLGLESQPLPEHRYVTNAERAERAENKLGNPTIQIARTWADAIDQSQKATVAAVR